VDRRDYILDLTSLPQASEQQGAQPTSTSRRPWIAIHWKCCHTYSRLYRNKKGDAYEGCCPRCGAPARAAIGRGGTSSRFFTAE
jgi:hypothetical protein